MPLTRAGEPGRFDSWNRVQEPLGSGPLPLRSLRYWMLCSFATRGAALRSRSLVFLSIRVVLRTEINSLGVRTAFSPRRGSGLTLVPPRKDVASSNLRA